MEAFRVICPHVDEYINLLETPVQGEKVVTIPFFDLNAQQKAAVEGILECLDEQENWEVICFDTNDHYLHLNEVLSYYLYKKWKTGDLSIDVLENIFGEEPHPSELKRRWRALSVLIYIANHAGRVEDVETLVKAEDAMRCMILGSIELSSILNYANKNTLEMFIRATRFSSGLLVVLGCEQIKSERRMSEWISYITSENLMSYLITQNLEQKSNTALVNPLVARMGVKRLIKLYQSTGESESTYLFPMMKSIVCSGI